MSYSTFLGSTGEGLEFTVTNGVCDEESALKIERKTAEETSDAEASYCTLPAQGEDFRTSTCTSLSSGMKIEGVGLFYDDRCNHADLSGCGARSIDACRLCFRNREEWLIAYPFDRIPDWELCPCCVAETFGESCETGGGGGGGPDEGVIIGVSVGIAGVLAIACCLSCAFGTTIVRFVSSWLRVPPPLVMTVPLTALFSCTYEVQKLFCVLSAFAFSENSRGSNDVLRRLQQAKVSSGPIKPSRGNSTPLSCVVWCDGSFAEERLCIFISCRNQYLCLFDNVKCIEVVAK